MDWMNRISIKRRIRLAFVLVVFLFIGFAVFSVTQMNELGKLTAILYEHPLKVSRAIQNAEADVLRMHRGMKDVAMSGSELELQTAINTVNAAEKDAYAHLDIVKNRILGHEGKTLVREAIEMFSGWKPIREEVLNLVLKGEKEAAGRITREKGADYVSRLNRKMAQLRSYAGNKADGFMKDAENVQQRILRNTILIIGLVVLLSLLIPYLITKSIVSSVSGLKNTMSEITKTGTLVKSDLSGNNEITDMAQNFNSLIDRLQDQFWLKKGQAAVGEEMIGDLTYEDLVAEAVNFISRYVDACAGALYIYDGNRSVCELKASYAFVAGKHFSNEFKLGEGIVGQVAIEKKPVLLNNITGDDALGKTGTVSESPRSIYTVPLLYGEEILYGVLEVALFEKINPLKIEFLQMAAGIVATALHAASQKAQIVNLLELTQKNNEELQSQTEELQEQAEELQSQTEELHQQSEELQEQNVELEVQKEQAKAATRLKSEFLANMSHELRTPLNSVMALSKVLQSQAKDKLSKEELSYLDIISRNGKNLLALINDILDLSKIEAGKMEIQPKVFSVGYLIESIMEMLEPVAGQKGIQLNQQVARDLPQIQSDETMVHQIIQNLVGNAVKFTDKGHVTVSAVSDTDNIRIAVADTGIGIAQNDLPHIFEEFRQVDGTSSRPYEGTGLGLTIASRVAILLGGALTVESVLGKGSVFTLVLPVKWDGIVPRLVKKIPDARKTDPVVNDQPNAASVSRILVVEDNEAAIIQVSKMLESEGYQVDLAYNGNEALEYIGRTIPDGIILDLMMPGMDGFELHNKIRAIGAATARIPVLVITAKSLTAEDIRKLNAHNIQQLIQKGDVDREAFLEKVREMLG